MSRIVRSWREPGTRREGERYPPVPCNRGPDGDAVDLALGELWVSAWLALGLHIETHHPAFEAGLGRWVAREHERIVAGHHVVGRAGELFERRVAFDHFGHVVGDGKYAAGVYVRVEMGGIRRQHDLAAPGLHAHALQALGVAADMVDGDPRHDLVLAVMEVDAAGKDLAHHRDHVVDLERHAQRRVAHAAPRGIGHLAVLQVAYATGRCMCHTALRMPFEVDDVVAMVRKVFAGRVDFHDGEDEIVPGVTVHHIGGHSKGLQSVRVKTRRGQVVLAADAAHLYAHMDSGRIFPITYNVAEVVEGYATLKKLASSPNHVVPGHDPLVLARYPAAKAGLEGWVVRLDVEPKS